MVDEPTLRNALRITLDTTDFPELGEKYEGKVRDNYTPAATSAKKDGAPVRYIVVTDRISAFDRVLGTVPFKGQVLNRLAGWWFDKTKDAVPNHMIKVADPNVLECVECTPVMVEMVVRAYATGTTSTSLWTHYEKGARVFCGHTLPEGLKKHQALPAPILTPTTKAPKGEHDVSGSREEILATGKVTAKDFDEAAALAMKLFAVGQKMCAERGLILVDTKYEFGRTPEGKLVVIDEIHTPDSSRFWKAATYEARMKEGRRSRSARQGLRAPPLHQRWLQGRWRRASHAGRRAHRSRAALHRSLRAHHRRAVRAEHRAAGRAHSQELEYRRRSMKATVVVRLKPEVLDPQGDAVRRALEKLGFEGVKGVRVGKIIEIELDDGAAKTAGPALEARLAKMSDEMLANPVIEDFEVKV